LQKYIRNANRKVTKHQKIAAAAEEGDEVKSQRGHLPESGTHTIARGGHS
jgi:hypothetical protein